jgi:hypothetical protein
MQSSNQYLLQYRDFAFKAGTYAIGLLGALIGLAMNERFKSLWSEEARGFLLAIVVAFALVVFAFIKIINQKCFLYKKRRILLEQPLGCYYPSFASQLGVPLIQKAEAESFSSEWKYAIAFCMLIALITVVAMIAFGH